MMMTAMTNLPHWLGTATADLILTRFATSRNLPTNDKPSLIKAFLTHILTSDARLIRVQDVDDPENIRVPLLAEYNEILQFFQDNNWQVPEEAQI
jgi:hypothetical protein